MDTDLERSQEEGKARRKNVRPLVTSIRPPPPLCHSSSSSSSLIFHSLSPSRLKLLTFSITSFSLFDYHIHGMEIHEPVTSTEWSMFRWTVWRVQYARWGKEGDEQFASSCIIWIERDLLQHFQAHFYRSTSQSFLSFNPKKHVVSSCFLLLLPSLTPALLPTSQESFGTGWKSNVTQNLTFVDIGEWNGVNSELWTWSKRMKGLERERERELVSDERP